MKYTQIHIKSNRDPYDFENSVNKFLKELGDKKVDIHYSGSISTYEALIVYEVNEEDKRETNDEQ